MALPKGKTAKELGFSVGDKFRVVGCDGSNCEPGDILELQVDDGSRNPFFSNLSRDGGSAVIDLDDLEPIEDKKPSSCRKLKAGDRATVIGNNHPHDKHQFTIGDEVEILSDEKSWSGRYLCRNLTRVYRDQSLMPEDLAPIGGWLFGDDRGRVDGSASVYTHTFTLSDHAYGIKHPIKPKLGGSIMSKLTLLAKKAFDKDTKTLIKAGVLDSDLEVADDQFVLSFLVDKYKTELAELAKAQMDEEKAEKAS